MKVSTKIVAGYAVLVLLMFGSLGWELILVRKMQSISGELSKAYFPAVSTGSQLRERLRDVEEFLLKHLLTGIEGYGPQLAEHAAAFEEVLGKMDQLASAEEPERAALERLGDTWREFTTAIEEAQKAQPPGTYAFLPVRLEDQLRLMYSQVEIINAAALGSIDRELARSAEIDQRATRVSWTAAAVALLLSVAVAFPIVRSLTGGLSRLTEGTRWLGAGSLARRIPEDRTDEFGDLARSFNRMADRLEELDHLKKDFVSSVSHELKSPIASSREIVQLLLDEVPGPLNEEQKRLLELSIRSSRRLSSMIGTLLDLARMDAGTITYDMRRQEPGSLIRSTLEEFEIALRDRELESELTMDENLPEIDCDADRVSQVLGNIIDNAMKFAPRGSTIRISVEKVGPDRIGPNGGVLTSVADRGPGVPDKHKEAVFARFRQVRPEGARHGRGGTGLGLAISRGIAEAHGGRIWVDDNPGGGSVFRLALPAASALVEVERGETRSAVR